MKDVSSVLVGGEPALGSVFCFFVLGGFVFPVAEFVLFLVSSFRFVFCFFPFFFIPSYCFAVSVSELVVCVWFASRTQYDGLALHCIAYSLYCSTILVSLCRRLVITELVSL